MRGATGFIEHVLSDELEESEVLEMLQNFDKFHEAVKKSVQTQELTSMPGCEEKTFLQFVTPSNRDQKLLARNALQDFNEICRKYEKTRDLIGLRKIVKKLS